MPIATRNAPCPAASLYGCVAAALLAAAVSSPLPADEAPADAPIDEELRCLALALYFEARSEGPDGMHAVGSVVLNRIEHEEFPSTPCEVVKQGGETPPCQFSWWCDGKSDVPRDAEQWEIALAVAAALLEDRGEDPTHGALFFHSASISAPWRVERTWTATIHGHVYYR
jgi:N-acetylmuramoyl-L-alanine amidase